MFFWCFFFCFFYTFFLTFGKKKQSLKPLFLTQDTEAFDGRLMLGGVSRKASPQKRCADLYGEKQRENIIKYHKTVIKAHKSPSDELSNFFQNCFR